MKETKLIGILIGIVLFVWSLSFLLLFLEETGRGTFGDMFGMVNALFTGLAFAGLMVTIRQQSLSIQQNLDSIKMQKEELELTRKEFHDQTATFKKQNFEATFFQLLRLHNDNMSNMDMYLPNRRKSNYDTVLMKGRDVFEGLYNSVYNGTQPKGLTRPVRTLLETYTDLHKSKQSDLEHYYRLLHNIVEYIDLSDLDGAEKNFYIKIVRAQLSPFEQVMIFLYCLLDIGEGLKKLVEEYSLLKGMPEYFIEDRNLFKMISPAALGYEVFPESKLLEERKSAKTTAPENPHTQTASPY